MKHVFIYISRNVIEEKQNSREIEQAGSGSDGSGGEGMQLPTHAMPGGISGSPFTRTGPSHEQPKRARAGSCARQGRHRS